ncbi:hypothetical protein R1sor_007158 [Riccia sorocarpa]|uniref:Uncharacterized protein n=1 Tax=Riccia sorocarpa TaxID=122646 RepID=A0ABD3HT50_9MARC
MDATPIFAAVVLSHTGTTDAEEIKELRSILKKTRIANLNDICDAVWRHITTQDYCTQKQLDMTQQQIIVTDKMDTILPPGERTQMLWQDAQGWTWPTKATSNGSIWSLTTKQWKQIIYNPKDITAEMNRRRRRRTPERNTVLTTQEHMRSNPRVQAAIAAWLQDHGYDLLQNATTKPDELILPSITDDWRSYQSITHLVIDVLGSPLLGHARPARLTHEPELPDNTA